MKRGYGAYGARWNWSEDEMALWEEWEEMYPEDVYDEEDIDLEEMSAEEWEYWTSLKGTDIQPRNPPRFDGIGGGRSVSHHFTARTVLEGRLQWHHHCFINMLTLFLVS